MTLLPHRTVAGQVAAQLDEHIRNGAWPGWLPAERELCAQFQVSRDTLRAALAQLRGEGVVTVTHGVGHRISLHTRHRVRPPAPKTIGLLAPEPLERLRPTDLLWIDAVKGLLQAAGFELRFHPGKSVSAPGGARSRPKTTATDLRGALS